MSQLVQNVAKYKAFSTTDLNSADHQVPLKEANVNSSSSSVSLSDCAMQIPPSNVRLTRSSRITLATRRSRLPPRRTLDLFLDTATAKGLTLNKGKSEFPQQRHRLDPLTRSSPFLHQNTPTHREYFIPSEHGWFKSHQRLKGRCLQVCPPRP